MANETFDPTGESDEDLLVWMASESTMPDVARAAFGELHRRHVKYLLRVCTRRFGEQVGFEGVEDLVQNAFWRSYESAHTFKPVGGDPAVARRRVLGWLKTIAERLFLDHLKAEGRHIPAESNDFHAVATTDCVGVAVLPLSPECELVREAIENVLNANEREVMAAFLQDYDPESSFQRASPGVLEDLKKRLGTTDEGIRQMRTRAKKKVKAFILSRNSAKVPGKVKQDA